jgi:hypothetical protein
MLAGERLDLGDIGWVCAAGRAELGPAQVGSPARL